MIVGVWGALVAAQAWVAVARGIDQTACPLRALTGVPCPTCGGTRAVMRLGEGDVVGAVVQNPLVVIGGALLAGLLALRLGAGRGLAVSLSRGERRAAWAASLLLVAALWAYQIVRHAGA
ncbi:MAG: DUF2752 domain-containing protein [Phycisphaerales bacterium]